MAIEMLLVGGAALGLAFALYFRSNEAGCLALAVIPGGMIAIVVLDQWLHPESLRSTSALDFLFGPLWPSLGGLAGFALGRLFRSIRDDQTRSDG